MRIKKAVVTLLVSFGLVGVFAPTASADILNCAVNSTGKCVVGRVLDALPD